jgi:hypothetical protein
MENNIKASHTRAMQYWFADGLMELSSAGICLVLGIYFMIMQIASASQAGFALLFLLVFVAAFGIRKVMMWYRERSTYPRTGYVEIRKGREDRRFTWIAIGFSFLLLIFMLYTIIRGIQTMTWMPVIGGVIYAFIFALTGYRTKLVRFYFLAGFCLVLGVFLALAGLGDFWGTALLSFCIGMVLLAFGIVTRMNYIKHARTSVEQNNEP